MNILWSALELLKIQARHNHLLEQRRAGSEGQEQPSTSQGGPAPALNPEQPQLPLAPSRSDAEATNIPDPETQSHAITKINLASDAFSNPQQLASSVLSVSSPPAPPELATQTQYSTPKPRCNNRPFITKFAEFTYLKMITVLTHLLPDKSQTSQETENQWKCAGVSVIGTKHIKKNVPCQDACRFKALTTGELIITVADGAGSAIRAQEGATLAANVAVNYLGRAILQYKPNSVKAWKVIIRHSFELARAVLIKQALDQATILQDYATTLQIIVISNDWTVSALIGDGTAIGLVNNNSLVSLMAPQRGEYANATNFITNASLMDKLAVQVWPKSVSGVAVLTDGLLNLAVNEKGNTPFPQFFNPLFKFLDASESQQQAVNSLTQFLQSDRINQRTDDDKTLVLARRAGR